MTCNHFLSPIYQVYSDLGDIDPYSVKTEEDEENYYKSLLYDCRNYDLVKDLRMFKVTHFCSRNGTSKYEQHQMETMNREPERLKEEK